MMRPTVILLGSKPGASVALSHMIERGWRVKAIVPSDQHSFIEYTKISEIAEKNKIPVYLKSTEVPNEKVDFVISYMHRNRVKKYILDLATKAAVNFHPGPLPEFGGWAFYNIAILENSPEYGCTCHYMDEGFDTGPLLKVRRFKINAPEETAWSLERKTQNEMIKLFHEFIVMAESGNPFPHEHQVKEKMRYLDKESFEKLKEIPTGSDLDTIDRYARAFFYPPYDCAYIVQDGKRLEVLPRSVKMDIAKRLHADDYVSLKESLKSP